jgi:hypothetical protein
MKAYEFETSKFLNAKSAGEYNGKTLTIYEVKSEIVREMKKMVIGFESVEKTLIVNKTNRTALTDAFGDETNDWYGRKVILHITRVTFDGQPTASIVLEPVVQQKLPTADEILAGDVKKAKPKK